jgi:hypothetical protein
MAAKRKLDAVYLIERAKINADRQAADKARAEQLAVQYQEEDAARLVERQKAEKIEADKIAADRLKEDMKLDAERLEAAGRHEGKRRHMRAAGNKEGVEFLEYVKKVFAESFEAKQGARVLYREARDAVSTSMSAVNENLFQRHAAKLLKEQWPCYLAMIVSAAISTSR